MMQINVCKKTSFRIQKNMKILFLPWESSRVHCVSRLQSEINVQKRWILNKIQSNKKMFQ